jgi:hypothetical protein
VVLVGGVKILLAEDLVFNRLKLVSGFGFLSSLLLKICSKKTNFVRDRSVSRKVPTLLSCLLEIFLHEPPVFKVKWFFRTLVLRSRIIWACASVGRSFIVAVG